MRWHFLAFNYISFRRKWHPIYELQSWRYKNITMKLLAPVVYLQHDDSYKKSSPRVYTVKYGIFYLHCQPLPVMSTWNRDHFSDVLSARIPNVLTISPILRTKPEINLIWIFSNTDPFWEYRNIHRWAYVNQRGVRNFRFLEISSI